MAEIENSSIPNSWDHALEALKTYWGYPSFRPPQDEVVKALLAKQDSFVFLPTGYGKSVCFQVPAVLGSGVTLVISPLIALMEDQVGDLKKRSIPAAALHGELAPQESKQVLAKLEKNQLRLLYLAPETLFSPKVWQRLLSPHVLVNALMIDESHTLVHWGDSFRPDYRRLGAVRAALQKDFPIAAFTATADPYTRYVLQQVLALKDPVMIQVDPLRKNIQLNVKIAWTPAGRKQQMIQFIRERKALTGLVYVRTRKDTEQLAEWFKQQGLMTEAYHGGLGSFQRRRLEKEWLEDRCTFLVCTNAFGMGVNKPNVRWVVHYHHPPTTTDYIQEVGRGGRDGKEAVALMLVSEPTGFLDPTDQQRQDFFMSQRTKVQAKATELLQKLPPEADYEEFLAAFGQEARVALALLNQAGCLVWTDPFHFRLKERPAKLPNLIPQGMDPLFTNPSLAMEKLITTKTCRWQVLLKSFGVSLAEGCGSCDNCRR